MLRYAPENKSSPMVATGKMAIEKLEINFQLKNKAWTNQQ
jgi:hypothetical protein